MQNLDHQLTLVMGARTGIGRLVFDQLNSDGLRVRASTRHPDPDQFPVGAEVVAADLTDRASLDAAFSGVGQVFLFANHDGVDDVIEAAHTAGVERIVLLSSGSVLHPSSVGNTITEEHRQVEAAFAAATDLTVVPIRPLVLATNSLGWAYPIRATGTMSLYRPDAVTAPIHERDIAAVIIAALQGQDDVSGILTGSERLSQREQVASIAAVIGRDLTVREIPRDEALAGFARFIPEEEAEAVLDFLDDAADGNSITTTTVEQILGRPAVGYPEWAADHADDFR